MHREFRDDIENLLAGARKTPGREHIEACEECRGDLEAMARHASLIQNLKAPANLDTDLRPGFYARVMERIEAEGPVSIWNMFVESAFGKRIAVASVALALLLGVYLFSSERTADDPMIVPAALIQTAQSQAAANPAPTQISQMQTSVPVVPASAIEVPDGSLALPDPARMSSLGDRGTSQDDVLVNLVTYREQ